jgi:hypothetical protein
MPRFPSTRMLRTFGQTADIYAPAASSGGTAGAMGVVSSGAVGLLVPVTDAQAAGLLALAPLGLAGGRSEHIWIDSGTATLGVGCEVRTTLGGTYAVEGTADWRVGRVALLSQSVPMITASAGGTATMNLDFSRAANSHHLPTI